MQIRTPLRAFVKNHLRGIADHEILLVNAQKTSCVIAVIGIQKKRQVLRNVRLVETDAFFYDTLIRAVHIEEAQKPALPS